MNTVKIVFGCLILIGFGGEYIHAGRSAGGIFSPYMVIFAVLVIGLCAWLIGSGFVKENISIKSMTFLKYYGLCFLVFILVAFMNLSSAVASKTKMDVTFNDITIPIGACIDGSEKIIPDPADRKNYCSCLAEKLANSDTIQTLFYRELRTGSLGNIMAELQKSPLLITLGIETCLSSVNMNWTPDIIDKVKRFKRESTGTVFSLEYDIDTYCDCVMEAYLKYPVTQVLDVNFDLTPEGKQIESQCLAKSKK